MKKLLLGTAAVALAATFVAGPANAQVKLDVGGHTKLYGSWVDQEEQVDQDGDGANDGVRAFDILRETELHFTGETTLDNGLTVGAHIETDIDGTGGDNFNTEEAYAYFSGAWGRVNFGAEDGAAYLLQVAAPSGDSNVDGIRQYVSGINYNASGTAAGAATATVIPAAVGGTPGGGTFFGPAFAADLLAFDYDQALSGFANKLTYMTPVFNGFQAGASYTPDLNSGPGNVAGVTETFTSRDFGNAYDDILEAYGAAWDAAARYEGQFDQVGVALGGGYSHVELEQAVAAPVIGDLDDREAWNVGIDFDWQAFGLGAVYTEDDLGLDGNSDRETWVVGLDYTTGPFKIAGSYYSQDVGLDGLMQAANSGDLETERWTAGVVYTYGPGMTFRGSVSFVDHQLPAAISQDFDGTNVLLGTQINF